MNDIAFIGQLEVWAANVHLAQCKVPEEKSDIFDEKGLSLFQNRHNPHRFILKVYQFAPDRDYRLMSIADICKQTMEYLKCSRRPWVAKRVLRVLKGKLPDPLPHALQELLQLKDDPIRVSQQDTQAILRRYLAMKNIGTLHDFDSAYEYKALLEMVMAYWNQLALFGPKGLLDEFEKLPIELHGLYKEHLKEKISQLGHVSTLQFDQRLTETAHKLVNEVMVSNTSDYIKAEEAACPDSRLTIVPFVKSEGQNIDPSPYYVFGFRDYLKKNPKCSRFVNFDQFGLGLLMMLSHCEHAQLLFDLTPFQMKLIAGSLLHEKTQFPASIYFRYESRYKEHFRANFHPLCRENSPFTMIWGETTTLLMHIENYPKSVRQQLQEQSIWVYKENPLYETVFFDFLKRQVKPKPVEFETFNKPALKRVLPYVERVIIKTLSSDQARDLVSFLGERRSERFRIPDMIITEDRDELFELFQALTKPQAPLEDGLYALYRSQESKILHLYLKSWLIRNEYARQQDLYEYCPFLRPLRLEVPIPRARIATAVQREAAKKIADRYEALLQQRQTQNLSPAILRKAKPIWPMVVIDGVLTEKPPEFTIKEPSIQRTERPPPEVVREQREPFLKTLESQFARLTI